MDTRRKERNKRNFYFKYLKINKFLFFLSANITGILCAMVVGQKEMRLVGLIDIIYGDGSA